MIKRKLGVAGVAAFAILLSACGSGSSGKSSDSDGSNAPLTHVKVTTGSDFHGAELPLMVGIAEGIYAKHGLEVEVFPNKGSSIALQGLGAGNYDFAWADATSMTIAVGKGLPLRVVGEMEKTSPYALIAYATANINSAADLKGKTGSFATGSTEEHLWPAYAKLAGLPADSVKFIKVSSTATRNGLFTARKVDFTFGLTNITAPLAAAACKCDVTAVSYADSNFSTVSQSLISTRGYIDSKPDTVRRFVEATVEATQYAIANPEKAVDDLMKTVGSKLTPVQTKEVVAEQWQKTIPLIQPAGSESKPLGCINKDQFQVTVDALRNADLIPSSVSAEQLYTTSFVSEKCA
jgi:NitT/TauT family transport system substrate-binding protein